MAFNVSDFRGQLEFGGARPSLFEVQIFNPVNGAGDLKFHLWLALRSYLALQ